MTGKHIGFRTLVLAIAMLLGACAAPTAQSPTSAPPAGTPIPIATATLPATSAPAAATPIPISATATPAAPSPEPSSQPQLTATAAPQAGSTDLPYLDDRSAAAALMESFYNAINRKEYARAYGYWQADAAGLPSYGAFVQGYATTSAVQVGYGIVTGDTGAGQSRYSVPVRITAQTSGGEQFFVGCYVLHLASPAAQGALPFKPLAIESATVQQSSTPATAGALEQACQITGQPIPTPAPDTGAIDSSLYLDNGSDPVLVLRSFYNAINRHEYVRAYSYWQDQSQLGALEAFTQGYSTTDSVALTTGTVQQNPGAGQRNERVPVTITSKQTDGTTQTFAGCYQLHLAVPAMQSAPFKPLGITAATIQQVQDGANPSDVMNQSCPAS